MNEQTPKQFVLQLGSLISLYVSVSFLLVLLFGLINIKFPDQSEGYYALESARDSIRLGIAMVIVFAPTYFILMRTVNKARRDARTPYLALTKWLIYLSLLIGGGALLVDLVIVINTFLEGDITQRFILKAFSVLVVIGAAFHYYLLDARGYWTQNEAKSVSFGMGAVLLILVALAYGFSHIETPAEVREGKIDEKQIADLQYLQSALESFYYQNNRLPESIEEMTTSGDAIAAPEGRPAYTYRLTESGFELCATFATSNKLESREAMSIPLDKDALIKNAYNWEHGVGEVCFNRVVSGPAKQ